MTAWSSEIALARERIHRLVDRADQAAASDDLDRLGLAAMLQERAFFVSLLEEVLAPDRYRAEREHLLDIVRQLDEASAPDVARLFEVQR